MSHHIYCRILGYITTIVVHVTNVGVMVCSFDGEPMKNDYVRHYNEMQYFFFTCWTFFFQTVYAVVGLWTDILTLKNSNSTEYELPKSLVFCRDRIFSILVWPATVLVFTLFWSLFHYDRSLVFPEDIDLVITSTSNHIMHTYILSSVLWEVVFRRREEPKTHMWNVLGLWITAFVYFSVLFFVYATKGVWVYPIFGVLKGTNYFYCFFVFILAYLPVIYYAQWALNTAVWGSRGKTLKVF